jgi:hypothetical protein
MRDSVVQGIFFLLVLAAITLISGCKNSSARYTALTENDVITIMNEVRKATLAKDLDGVINHLAPFVVINVSMMGPEDPSFIPQQIQMTRDQYKEELKKVFSKLTLHEYKRENDKITISDDKRSAITETDVIEVMVIGGKETRTTTHERAVLEIIDGKLLVTHLDAVIVKRE